MFSEFDNTTAEQWKQQLEKDLKGVTFEQLSMVDNNNITIHPFYTAADAAEKHSAAFQHTDWNIVEKIAVTQEATANARALKALNQGASGLIFSIEKSEVDWAQLLRDIGLQYVYCRFDFKVKGAESSLEAYLRASDFQNCFLGNDEIGEYIKTEKWCKTNAPQHILQQLNSFRNLAVDATIYHNAGASTVTQLAYAVAQLNEYLNILDEQNALDKLQKVHISLATGTAFFEEIAKLRALRHLLVLVFQQYGITPQLHFHAVTGKLHKAPFDIYNNLLRDTLAAMAAVLGGCSSLYVLPFDEGCANNTPDFSSRMSLNQQLILKSESYLNEIADAANGSYYIDCLTQELGEKAWSLFKEIEAEGGFIAAFEKGIVAKRIAEEQQKLVAQYLSGEKILIGINKYPNAVDMPKPLPANDLSGSGIQEINLSALLIKE